MNRQIDLSHIGGFPLEEDTLAFMQSSYTGALSAIAKLCGDKVILYGVEVVAGNVTDGWISVNGELIPFIGGPVGAKVVIVNPGTDAMFEDDTMHTVYFTKSATCAALGDFDFSELVPLLSFQNTWLPGDLKQKYVDNAYIASNFDVDGYGVNAEKGWRILSAQVPDAAGKTLVNHDSTDTDFNEAGKSGGEKKHTLLPAEQGDFTVAVKTDDEGGASGSGFATVSRIRFNGVEPADGAGNATAFGTSLVVALRNTAAGHNNLQPYFVVLTLIKL